MDKRNTIKSISRPHIHNPQDFLTIIMYLSFLVKQIRCKSIYILKKVRNFHIRFRYELKQPFANFIHIYK